MYVCHFMPRWCRVQAYESERLWWYCEEMMHEATRWVEAWRARQLKCIETSLKESAADPSNKVRARVCAA